MGMDTRGIVGTISRIREKANLFLERALREHGMKGVLPAHGSVLTYLFDKKGPVPIKEVVANIRRVKSTVTEMLNTLEAYGYVERVPSDDDHRVVFISLTQKGLSLRDDFDAISERLLERVYRDMTGEDMERLNRLLAEIEKNLE
jgi:DNA-binding MarR family transcriptional regulator